MTVIYSTLRKKETLGVLLSTRNTVVMVAKPLNDATLDTWSDEINYHEDPSFEGFQIIQYATYDDGTILLRVRPSTDDDCRASGLYFRLIRTDGTITPITLNNSVFRNISSKNYCFVNSGVAFTLKTLSTPTKNGPLWIPGYRFPIAYLVSNSPTDAIRIYGIAPNYILISYLCGNSDANVCGLVLNWSGNVLNSNASGVMSTINAGRINNISKFSPNYTSIFPLEDGGYGIVTAQYNTTNYTVQGTSFTPPWTVFVYFISEGNDAKGPFQLYQQTTESLDQLRIFSCSISFQSSGYNCIIYEVLVGATEPAFITIDFFRTGARRVSKIFTISGLSTHQFVVWDILNLFKGGYCVLRQNINTSVIDGLIYDNDGNSNGTWRMPTNYSYTRNIGVFPNNTLWAVANGPDNLTLTLVTSSALVDFRTVSPGNSSIIPLSSTPTLTISFTTNISLSSGNVSIYQSNGSFPILRQSFRGTDKQYVRLLNGTNIQFDVLTSTFNQRSSNYFIQVDNAFVEDVKNSQPLLGIRSSLWTVTTDSNDNSTNPDQKSAIIRLTPDGTKYFKNLPDSNRIQFASEMSQDISSVAPCDTKCIITTSNYQFDEHRQVLLRIDVKNYVNSLTERDPSKVVEDLDTLIKNRDVTKVSRGFYTSMLDPSFGTQPIPGADIDVLNILSSECGRLEELSAPFSTDAMKLIRIFNVIAVIIEDIPQLIILTWYQIYTVVPNIIPTIALASSCIILLFKFACLTYSSILLRRRLIDEHIPEKPATPSSGRESETSQEPPRVRSEYLTMKDGVPVVSFPREEDDRLSLKQVPSAHVEESITSVEEGKSGEIGVTLKKEQSSPTSEPGTPNVYQSKMIEKLDPTS
ncbi:12816_t:CDS:2 [Racocetra persica]|uniref:12816_t:CDS:1 n=1 Tax=Racocetra persica TaxID=160502 RepID=A0ACA9KF31_9GLOM|nr:12816_t:CDS:2 [Racocetra persica]